MIPLKLELTNFLSYQETAALDFQGIHLACISGRNGAGKSSILDGMTWALFGKSRSRSDDDVVNRLAAVNGEAAEVRLTFALEESVYRVIRQKKPRRSTVLELQLAGSDGESWKTLSEGKVRETQAAIEQLLRMNYDTFTNASFLLQGQADEFTTKTPNRRKEILADLLGVTEWEVYREAAAARRKEVEGSLLLVEGRLADIAVELAERPERETALAEAEAALADLLDRLTTREQLLTSARQQAVLVRQQQVQQTQLQRQQQQSAQKIETLRQRQAAQQAERDGHQHLLDEAETIASDYAAWQAATAELTQWQQRADAYGQLVRARHPHEVALAQARTRLEGERERLRAQQTQAAALLAERPAVAAKQTATAARRQTLDEQIAHLGTQADAWQAARTELGRLEAERAGLERERATLQAEAARQAQLVQEKKAVTNNLSAAAARLAHVESELATLNAQQERLLIAQADLDRAQSEQPRLKEEMDLLKERLDKLAGDSGSQCPLCGQPLSADHRAQVLTEVQAEGKAKADRYRENQAQIKALTAEVAELQKVMPDRTRLERDLSAQRERQANAGARQAEIERAAAAWAAAGALRLAELDEQLADTSAAAALEAQMATLADAVEAKALLEAERAALGDAAAQQAARLEQIDAAQAAWTEAGAPALADVEKQLAADDFAPEARAALAALNVQLAELAYDDVAHEAARQAVAAHAEAPQRQQALQQATTAVRHLDQALADLDAQLAAEAAAQTERAAQLAALTETLAALTGPEAIDLDRLEDEVQALREEKTAADRRVAVAGSRLDVLSQRAADQKALQAEKNELNVSIQRLKMLETAFGRKGVPALLIEQAIPDIEESANQLLARLTGGEMRVMFDTQRQLKSRDALAETLEIRIGDSAGERPYENFSGGEQFRVNFAIRLALSQVLAKRAGARLQTLVVDEGFGSQDPLGRQRLVEAINTIQTDFARILVITHIDELKDAFPTRIEVEKGPAGSAITVL